MKLIGLLLAGMVAAAPSLAVADLPSAGTHKHLGVASCASSTCHGSVSQFRDSNVAQNEFAKWQGEDPHAETYQLLHDERSKRIAAKLGLDNAHEQDMCLDCHADNVPAAARGEKFDLADGVGCEACHGGAEQWLSSHASGQVSHEDNLAAGLYPTEDPVARGRLCMACHLGNKDQMITHRIMGAGHPRLSFELDTFTWLHPHFEIDQDYLQRKGEVNGARDWAVGQGVAAATQLETLLDDRAGWDGIFPELVLFDCHACHRSMFGERWAPRRSTGLGPGVVRYNDASLLMLRHVVTALDESDGERMSDQIKDLHLATTRGRDETRLAARQLLETINGVLPRVKAARFDGEFLRGVLASILADGEQGQYRDYAAAEQASMAVDSVILAFEGNGLMDSDTAEALRAKAQALFEATEDEENYRPSDFVSALRALESSAP